MSEKKLAILKKHYREYFKDSFPAERLEKVANQALCIKEETEAIFKAMEEYAAAQHPGTAIWVKASEFKYEAQVAYHAKDNESKGAGFFNKTGCFLWGDGSITHPRDQDDLLILDESPSKEGNKDQEVDGLSLLKFISEIGWGSVGGGEFINHNNGRIIKEQTLLKEFNEWNNQQNRNNVND